MSFEVEPEVRNRVNVDSVIYSEDVILFTNLLLSINNQDNYRIIQNNIQNYVVLNYLNYFSNNELTISSLENYLNKNQNMDMIKEELFKIINNNKSTLLYDLEEQYFSVKKNIYYYHCFHDALLIKKISRSSYLEAEFNNIEQNFRSLKELFEPNVINIYEDKFIGDASQNLSNLKSVIDVLERDTLNYKKKLCSFLDIPSSQWKKEFNNYCSHLKEIEVDEIEQINKSIKRMILSFENEPVLDKISENLQSNLFIKLKKTNSIYLFTYANHYLNKPHDGNFCRKILHDVFNHGFINQWKHYRTNFSRKLTEQMFSEIHKEIPSINKLDFSTALDNYIDHSPVFNEILTKSIKETYRKKDNKENLLDIDFRTAFIHLNYKFSNDIIETFYKKFETEKENFKEFILMNLGVEISKPHIKQSSPFDILVKKSKP